MSPDLLREFGWTLIHFLWQGTLLAVLLQPILAGCRRAELRYNWSLATLGLMAAAPVVTFAVLRHPGGGGIGPGEVAAGPAAPASAVLMPAGGISWMDGLVGAWFAGVTGLSLRVIGGWVLLERLRRETAPLPTALLRRCRALQHSLDMARPVRFVQSAQVSVPAVIGWFRPTVLIPLASLSGLSTRQVDAVILHELAHIRRLDAFANLFQILVETLLFYHPAVWWVSRRIRVERENCCDDIAVSICGDAVGYARALTLLETRRGVPVMALAASGGALKHRVIRLLAPRPRGTRLPAFAPAAIALVCLAASITAGHALTAQPEPEPAAAAPAGQTPDGAEAQPAQTESPPAQDGSYIGALAAAGLTNLSVDQLIALKNRGITADYVAALRKAGFEPSIEHLLALSSLGVKPEDAAAFRALGLNDLSVRQLLTFRSVGVTPDYVGALKSAGLGDLSAKDYVEAKATGVTPDYIAGLRSHGMSDLNMRKVIALKTAGIF
jgi:beta-lactamase regulating signal transducer with metallopeptidase domain